MRSLPPYRGRGGLFAGTLPGARGSPLVPLRCTPRAGSEVRPNDRVELHGIMSADIPSGDEPVDRIDPPRPFPPKRQRGEMQRRRFIGVTATGALGAAAVGLAERKAAASAPQAKPRVRGDVVASWPAFLDALYRGPRSIADTVARLTDGKFVIDVHPGGGSWSVRSTSCRPSRRGASRWGIQRPTTTSTPWGPVTASGTGIPFGLTARHQNAWLYDAGGQQLLRRWTC
jgi:hypothetical protein